MTSEFTLFYEQFLFPFLCSKGNISPTGSRANAAHVRTPTSPTFAKRQRLPSEVSNIDMKRMSIMSLSELDDGSEDTCILMSIVDFQGYYTRSCLRIL